MIGVARTAPSLDSPARPQLEQDALLALWQDGVPLGTAWLVFADEWSTTQFRELQQTHSHLPLQQFLKDVLIDDLRTGKRQAFGVQEGSDAGLVLVPPYYFLKTAEVNWEKDIVRTAGKIFYGVRVKWEREPPDPTRPRKPAQWIHQRELEALSELRPQTEREGFIDPSEEWEQESLDQTLSSDLTQSIEPSEFTVQSEREAPRDAPQSKPGRPLLVPKVRQVVRELIDQGKLGGKLIKEVEELVRAKAQERFKRDFFGPRRPSKPTIIAAVDAEGWYSPDEN
jgi:hypothetical protein